jgi:membrane-associated protease RseP (regulator of RpoE activity)
MKEQTYESPPDTLAIEQLREALRGLMHIEHVRTLTSAQKPFVEFGGQLAAGDQDAVFDEIVRRFEVLGYTPMLTTQDDLYVLRALPQVVTSKPGRPWINALLFILTLFSVLFIGASHENVTQINFTTLWEGLPFAATLLAILTAHELSHYFVGRMYGSPVSLPYFIPLPTRMSLLGTMGALIVQRGPMRSRKALFDIGVAGPLGGLVVAVPLLIAGLAFTKVGTPSMFMDLPQGEPLVVSQEGNSLMYLAAKYLVHGRVLPNPQTGEDVWLSPPSPGGSVAFAAWAGLLVTMFNLFPVGQLDGGHVAYAMWGRRAWWIARGVLALMFIWGVFLLARGNFAGGTWLAWGGLTLLMGPRHPPPLNDVTPLDAKRTWLGWVMVVIFLLILIPIPWMPVVIR